MRDVFAAAASWLEQGCPFAFATLVALRDARTAPLGTTIAVALDGEIAGSIGAGCYEAELIETALQSAGDGVVRRVEIQLDDDALMGGSGCGATMSLVVWRPGIAFLNDAHAIASGDRSVHLSIDGFEHVFPPREPLLLIGATALAQDVAAVAHRADFYPVVIDPRPVFATRQRLGDAAEIVREWPEDALPRFLSSEAAVVVLSHDPKLDLPALRCVLRSDAWYVGLLGSRRTQQSRRSALLAEGFSELALERIHGPVGLDIGGRSSGETAISILAEIIAVRNGRVGVPLVQAAGAIH